MKRFFPFTLRKKGSPSEEIEAKPDEGAHDAVEIDMPVVVVTQSEEESDATGVLTGTGVVHRMKLADRMKLPGVWLVFIATSAVTIMLETLAIVIPSLTLIPLAGLHLAAILSAIVAIRELRILMGKLPPDVLGREQLKAWESSLRDYEQALKITDAQLAKRHAVLRENLLKYNEILEFPQSLKEPDSWTKAESPRENDRFLEQDRLLGELLERQVDFFFTQIKKNAYRQGGRFQGDLLVKDLMHMVEEISRIYQSRSREPLLETSVQHLLRAINRLSLQLLVLFDQLPVDLKEYNFKTMADYIRNGVNLFGYYKKAEPIWPFVRSGYYLTRYLLGTNPVTLTGGLVATQIVKTLGTNVASRYAKQYAIGLLRDLVFIFGTEVAQVFTVDYRFRASEWLYGVEIVELVSRFPLSRTTLHKAMQETGNLPLRSEYDRIYLYRCLAAHVSSSPARFKPREFLSIQQRREIADRVVTFLSETIHGQTEKRIGQWKRDFEERFDLKITVPTMKEQHSESSERRMCLRALMAFLVYRKQRTPLQAVPLLVNCKTASGFNEEQAALQIARLSEEVPFSFQLPDCEPTGQVCHDFLFDIMEYSFTISPADETFDSFFDDIVVYYRQSTDEWRKSRDHLLQDLLNRELVEESVERKVKPQIMRAVFGLLNFREHPRFLYRNAEINDVVGQQERARRYDPKKLWFLGTTERLLLFSVPGVSQHGIEPWEVIWSYTLLGGQDPLLVAEVEHRFVNDCRLTGGMWESGSEQSEGKPVISLAGQTMSRFETYFNVLLKTLAMKQFDEEPTSSENGESSPER